MNISPSNAGSATSTGISSEIVLLTKPLNLQSWQAKKKDSEGFTKVISKNKNNRKKVIPKKNQYKEASQNQFEALNINQEQMDPNYLTRDEAGEEGQNQANIEYEDRDTIYMNSGKENSQEDTKMEQIATEGTLEESAI